MQQQWWNVSKFTQGLYSTVYVSTILRYLYFNFDQLYSSLHVRRGKSTNIVNHRSFADEEFTYKTYNAVNTELHLSCYIKVLSMHQ